MSKRSAAVALITAAGEIQSFRVNVGAALVLDDYAVTQTVEAGTTVRGEWSVTHRQSGCSIATNLPRVVAMRLARKVQAIAPGLVLPDRVTKKTPPSKEARLLVAKIKELLSSAEAYS